MMKLHKTRLVATLFAAAFLTSASFCDGDLTTIDPPSLQIPAAFVPVPEPNAQVVVTNSAGEVIQQGKTDDGGLMRGERGPGRITQIFYVDITLADGTKLRREIRVPEGYRITSMRVFIDQDDYVAQYEPATPRVKTEGGGGGGDGGD